MEGDRARGGESERLFNFGAMFSIFACDAGTDWELGFSMSSSTIQTGPLLFHGVFSLEKGKKQTKIKLNLVCTWKNKTKRIKQRKFNKNKKKQITVGGRVTNCQKKIKLSLKVKTKQQITHSKI